MNWLLSILQIVCFGFITYSLRAGLTDFVILFIGVEIMILGCCILKRLNDIEKDIINLISPIVERLK